MPRPQFGIRTLLWLTLVVAAFFGGMAVQRRLDLPTVTVERVYPLIGPATRVTLPDGTEALQQRPVTMDEYKKIVARADKE